MAQEKKERIFISYKRVRLSIMLLLLAHSKPRVLILMVLCHQCPASAAATVPRKRKHSSNAYKPSLNASKGWENKMRLFAVLIIIYLSSQYTNGYGKSFLKIKICIFKNVSKRIRRNNIYPFWLLQEVYARQ